MSGEGLAAFVIIPGKESCVKIVLVSIQNNIFFNLGLILKNNEFSSNVCRYLLGKGNIIASYS